VNSRSVKQFRVVYLAFLIPFILTWLSWAYLPVIAHWIVANLFGYNAVEQSANPIWLSLITFFYTWYTLLAIGVAGTWVVGALLARKKYPKTRHEFYPMVSFVIPAYNQEANISRCIASVFRCAEKYGGNCEIIVVDDGSTDFTYETAWSALRVSRIDQARVRCRVVRHMANLGKIEALRTGVNRALGGIVAIVDADSEWAEETLSSLVDYVLSNGKKAVTGYVHPCSQRSDGSLLVGLQRLEYSRGLSIGRCAQSLGDKVLVVSGAIGVYDAFLLRGILWERNVRSVTEDLEVTLEMHKKGAKVGYVSVARCSTAVPVGLGSLVRQRLRWFTGWLVNTLGIHRDLMFERSWLSALLWYCYVFEFFGAFVDLAALLAFPFLWWFAPDVLLFGLNILVFGLYGLLVGVVFQAVALKLAYGSYVYGGLLFYMPLYSLLRLVNVFARVRSVLSYLRGGNGKWHLGEA